MSANLRSLTDRLLGLKTLTLSARTKTKFWRFQLPALLYAGLIFGLSSIPDLSAPRLDFASTDKIIHFLEYSGFSVFLFRAALGFAPPIKLKSAQLFATLAGILFAFTDELHQSFVPGRTAEVWDLVADSLGILFTQLIIYRWIRTRQTVKLPADSPLLLSLKPPVQ